MSSRTFIEVEKFKPQGGRKAKPEPCGRCFRRLAQWSIRRRRHQPFKHYCGRCSAKTLRRVSLFAGVAAAVPKTKVRKIV